MWLFLIDAFCAQAEGVLSFAGGRRGTLITPVGRDINYMPLNAKGKKIRTAMRKEYGKKKGTRVFYKSENKGTIKGVKK